VSLAPRKRPVSEQPALPWQLPRVEPADIFAVQALERGNASEAQQRRIYDLVRRLTACERMTFYPGGEDGRRASDFAEGKRWVGDQWRRLLRMRPQHEGVPLGAPEPRDEVIDVA
jgi:hypothetical protein